MTPHPFRLIPTQDLGPPSPRLLLTIPHPTIEGYPTIRSPIVYGTHLLDSMWVHFAERNNVYAGDIHPYNCALRQLAITTKCLHLQTIFWGRIDRVNRRTYSSLGGVLDPVMWSGEEMKAMLNWFRLFFHCPSPYNSADGMWRLVLENSPWWDCPLYEHLLSEKQFAGDGQPLLNRNGRNSWENREPRNAELEREFVKIWRERGIGMPVRRMENGDVVCREGYEAWVAEVGEGAAADWYAEAYAGL